MFKKIFISIAILLFSFAFTASTHAAAAASANDPSKLIFNKIGDNEAPMFVGAGTGQGMLQSVITLIYTWLNVIIVAGAVLMIVVGGIQISTAGPNSEGMSGGKTRIIQALSGVALFYMTGFILQLINPTFFGGGKVASHILGSDINTLSGTYDDNGIYTAPNLLGASGDGSIVGIIISMTTWMLGLAAGISTLMIIIGGVQYITGGLTGSENGKKTVQYAIVGLVISMLGYTIISILANDILNVGGA